VRKLLTVLALGLVCAPAAQATAPGQNGKIVFWRDWCMYTMNPDGSNPAPVLPCDESFEKRPRWSPDGQQIAFIPEQNGTSALAFVNADGTNLRPYVYEATRMGGHGWSPDGTQLAVVNGYSAVSVEYVSVEVFPATAGPGSGHSIFSDEAADFYGGLDWSPDGARIAVGMQGEIYTIRHDGTDLAQVTSATPGVNLEPNWSPDGRQIVFASSRDGDYEIYVMNVDGTGQTSLTNNTSLDFWPRWSPDGSKIVFASNRDGNQEVYVMNPDGTEQTRLTNSTVNDFEPDWQPVPVNGYPRPRGATPLQVYLVPAYQQCLSPTRTHGPPLAFPSCNPPAQESGQLTVGTADANGRAAKSIASIRFDTVIGQPGPPADEADVQITATISDVYAQAGLADYTGGLQATVPLRITDKLNTPHPGGPGAGTVSDTTLEFEIPCAATADTTVGSTCTLNSTVDTVIPGAVTESKRSIWELGQVQVNDGGGAPFLRQGIFIP
jgi:hypothetical protein